MQVGSPSADKNVIG